MTMPIEIPSVVSHLFTLSLRDINATDSDAMKSFKLLTTIEMICDMQPMYATEVKRIGVIVARNYGDAVVNLMYQATLWSTNNNTFPSRAFQSQQWLSNSGIAHGITYDENSAIKMI